jgi:hypothetical protein
VVPKRFVPTAPSQAVAALAPVLNKVATPKASMAAVLKWIGIFKSFLNKRWRMDDASRTAMNRLWQYKRQESRLHGVEACSLR